MTRRCSLVVLALVAVGARAVGAETPPERLLWSWLRGGRVGGARFRRQQVVDGSIADFYCPTAALVVEVVARRPGSRVPTLSDMVRYVMRERWGRVGMLLVWWWLGFHFLSRS